MTLILLAELFEPLLSVFTTEFVELSPTVAFELEVEDDVSILAGLKGSVKFRRSCKNSKNKKNQLTFVGTLVMVLKL